MATRTLRRSPRWRVPCVRARVDHLAIVGAVGRVGRDRNEAARRRAAPYRSRGLRHGSVRYGAQDGERTRQASRGAGATVLWFWSAHAVQRSRDDAPSWRESYDRLRPDYQRLLWCRFVEGQSLADTARSMHVTVRFAQVLQLRALRALQSEQARTQATLAAIAAPALTPAPCNEPTVAAGNW